MEIITDRLLITDISTEHLPFVHELLTEPEVTRYNTLPIPDDRSNTRHWIDSWVIENKTRPRLDYTLAVKLSVNNEIFGLLGLKLHPEVEQGEVWYKLHPDHWGNGYGQESLLALLQFGFQSLNLHRIEAGTAIENIASWKVMEKAGMIREATRKQALFIRGTWYDHYQYGLLQQDFNGIG
ncbi:MAG: GNAT family N-acetyltransferase [Cyclobacteriaceae bacterium]